MHLFLSLTANWCINLSGTSTIHVCPLSCSVSVCYFVYDSPPLAAFHCYCMCSLFWLGKHSIDCRHTYVILYMCVDASPLATVRQSFHHLCAATVLPSPFPPFPSLSLSLPFNYRWAYWTRLVHLVRWQRKK